MERRAVEGRAEERAVRWRRRSRGRRRRCARCSPSPSPSPNPNPNPSPNPNQVNKHFMLEDPEDLDVDWLEAKIAGKH